MYPTLFDIHSLQNFNPTIQKKNQSVDRKKILIPIRYTTDSKKNGDLIEKIH